MLRDSEACEIFMVRESVYDRRSDPTRPHVIAVLIGNPNSGKTTLFNALTGLHQRSATIPGSPSKRRRDRSRCPARLDSTLYDLPGTYSMHAVPDEHLTADVVLGRTDHTPHPTWWSVPSMRPIWNAICIS